jgi:hypothetical protein
MIRKCVRFFEIGVLELTINDVNGVIMEGPRIVNVFPNIEHRA